MAAATNKKVLIINGPNLNMLGQREPEKYGSDTLAEIDALAIEFGQGLGLTVVCFQSNQESDIVDKIQSLVNGEYHGLIINPAAYTHTSVAIRDALLLLNIPIAEVHLSNIFKREAFRHKSLVTDVATGQITGFGKTGYIMALQAMQELIRAQ